MSKETVVGGNGGVLNEANKMPVQEQKSLENNEELNEIIEGTEKDCLDPPKKMISVSKMSDLTDRYDARVITIIILWYFWSGCTLYLNKYLVDYQDADATLLSSIQMGMTIIIGYFQQKHSFGLYTVEPARSRKPLCSKYMILIGGLRYATAFLGLYALKYVEVSFTETVKSTAPAFTLLISSLILGEKTNLMVKISILPVMGGLALCSANEAKFNYDGFLFALSTNLSECLQNVLSKKILSFQNVNYNPGEIQYHTGIASIVAQIPTLFLFATSKGIEDMTGQMAIIYLFNGICFHFQTISGIALMEAISPVTHSVVNTLKRAVLIWVSVIIFKNPITLFSGIGTIIVFMGVLFYNAARR